MLKFIIPLSKLLSEYKPKHTIYDEKKFLEERTKLGGLAQDGMNTTGGTDIDWVIEHMGGFIVMENKTFVKDWINIPVGQMITFTEMYKKLNSDGRCHFLIFGFESDVDFKNPDSKIWYFDMMDWENGKICPKRTVSYKKYGVHKREMTMIILSGYRKLMERYWKEFENKPQKNKQKKEAQKKNRSAYEPWTESNDEFLKNYWNNNSNKLGNYEKILELSKELGRGKGAILSRLEKKGLVF
jgi:hypothetical protein